MGGSGAITHSIRILYNRHVVRCLILLALPYRVDVITVITLHQRSHDGEREHGCQVLGHKDVAAFKQAGGVGVPRYVSVACVYLCTSFSKSVDRYSTYEKGKSELMFGLVSSPGSGSKLRLDVSVNIITHNESFLWKKFKESQENILWDFG